MHGPIPGHGALNGGGKGPAGAPCQLVVGFVDLQVQATGFVGGRGIGEIMPATGAVAQGCIHEFADAAVGLRMAGALAEVSAEMAIRLALVPEFTSRLSRTPRKAASSRWNASPSEPSVSQKLSVLLTAASTSSSVNTLPA